MSDVGRSEENGVGVAGPKARGRRRSGARTRERILEVARAEFAARGYDAATLRGIAREAGVDPALVHHYFDGKSDVFTQALDLPEDVSARSAAVMSVPREQLGEAVIRSFLEVWDVPGGRERMQAMLRGAVASEDAARPLREFVLHTVVEPIARSAGVPDPEKRAAVAASQILGIGLLRYVVADTALGKMPSEEVVAIFAPTLQRYLADPQL